MSDWEEREAKRPAELSEVLGAPGNLKLATYVDGLSRQLDRLEAEVDRLARQLLEKVDRE